MRKLLIATLFVLSALPAFAEPMDEALAKLDQRAAKMIADKEVVGMAVGVIYKDQLVFAKGYGPREAGKPELIDPDTVFQLASVSKPISATFVAGLVGDKVVTWDSKISDLDPSFALHNAYVTQQVTIRDLFGHRTGLPEHAGDLLEDLGYDRAQVLHRLRYQLPDSSFRSHYAYTNFGLTEGAVAAAKAANSTFEEAIDRRLFKPLNMTSTSGRYADFMARPNHAWSHVKVNGVWAHKSMRQPDAQSPAGGISSSVNDMAKWMRLRLASGKFEGKQLIDEKALDETDHPGMLTGFSPATKLPGFYGLGMNVSYDDHGRLNLGHSGGFAMGNATCISMVPSEQVGIVVLTNTYPVGVAEAMTLSFMDDFLYGKQRQDWLAVLKKVFADPATLGVGTMFDFEKAPAVVAPPSANVAYVGSYDNDYYGTTSVTERDGHLFMRTGPSAEFPLKHYTRDIFTYLPPGENSPGVSGVTFLIGPDGKAKSVRLENLNEQGQGTFERVAASH